MNQNILTCQFLLYTPAIVQEIKLERAVEDFLKCEEVAASVDVIG
jgi:hypothetical protein